MTTLDERVTRLEAVNEQILQQLEHMNTRINVQIQITVAMWITTILAILVVLFKN